MQIKKIQTNKYTLSSIILVFVLTLSYIICIYKTVVLASDSEINIKNINTLTANINQKEFDYIQQVSEIDLDKALALGYTKNTGDKIAYFNIKDNNELAIR